MCYYQLPVNTEKKRGNLGDLATWRFICIESNVVWMQCTHLHIDSNRYYLDNIGRLLGVFDAITEM